MGILMGGYLKNSKLTARNEAEPKTPPSLAKQELTPPERDPKLELSDRD